MNLRGRDRPGLGDVNMRMGSPGCDSRVGAFVDTCRGRYSESLSGCQCRATPAFQERPSGTDVKEFISVTDKSATLDGDSLRNRSIKNLHASLARTGLKPIADRTTK